MAVASARCDGGEPRRSTHETWDRCNILVDELTSTSVKEHWTYREAAQNHENTLGYSY